MNLRSFAALLAVSLSLPSALGAGQPASAAHATRAPAATRSVAELRAAAVSGSAEAEYELAERLAVDGVDEHRTEAILWLERAAAQGHADAQTHLSWAYHVGVGVETNYVEAVKWERLAAEKGQASAQFYLGSDYEFGLGGLPKDAAQAAHWYRRAAEQNHPIAQARLGDFYAEGRGVPRNDREAVAWYLRAMLQKDYGGQLGLGRMYAAGRGVPKDEKTALRWFERAADQEVATLSSALLNDAPEMSQARKRDYFLAFYGAGRHSALPGASEERDDLSAKLRALDRAENERTGKPLAAPVAKPEDFCPRLAAVMAARTTNFATLRGKGSEAEGWEATEALPGMHPCSVQSANSDDDAPPFTYRCTVAEEVDASAADAISKETQRLVTQCLGASWHTDEVRHPHHAAVFFSNEKSPFGLELSQREWLRSKYVVALAVFAPLAPLTLKRSRAGGAIDLDSLVDFKSEKAGAGNVVRAFQDLLGSDLFIDVGLTGKVTLDRKSSPLREVLDAVCAQVGCVWSFKTKQPRGELHIQRKKR